MQGLRIRIPPALSPLPCITTRAPLPSSDKEGAISIPKHNNGGRRGLNHSMSTGAEGSGVAHGVGVWKHDRGIFFSCRLMHSAVFTGCLADIYDKLSVTLTPLQRLTSHDVAQMNLLHGARVHHVLLSAHRGARQPKPQR